MKASNDNLYNNFHIHFGAILSLTNWPNDWLN